MADIEKVIKGLQVHESGCGYRSHHCDDMDCPYRYGDESCDIEEMCHDALELLKELKETNDKLTMAFLTLPDWNPVIVRCKDCRHFNWSNDLCEHTGNLVSEKFYCADGERK